MFMTQKAAPLGFFSRISRLFEQQKALVGDAALSVFGGDAVAKPREDSTYKHYYEHDATVGVSIDALSNMRLGSGFYVTVEDEKKSQPALDMVNELNERIHLDEVLSNVDRCMDIYGRCPVERVTRRGPPGGILELLVLDPPSVEYKRAVHGQFLGFTQKVKGKQPVQFGPDELIWFCSNQAGNGQKALYGISRIQRVLPLLEIREQVIKNINGIMKNQARPPIIWKVKAANDVDTLKMLLKKCKEAGSDPIVQPKDSIDFEVVKTDTKAAYWDYVDYIDTLIFQGLHSPMLNYLRNATEASASIMLDVIKADVEGRQRYLKRMVEHEIWEWHLRKRGWTGEIPSLQFGSPKTGLEDINIDQFIMKGLELQYIDQAAFVDILRQKGLKINVKPVEPEKDLPVSPLPDDLDLTREERKARIAALHHIANS